MSLEAQLEALTVAVVALTNRMATAMADAGGPQPSADTATVENTGATQATTTKAATSTKPTPAKTTAKTDAKVEGDNVVSYDSVKNAVIKLAAGKGRDAAVAILNTFGVDNAQKLKPDQYGQALEALELAAA